MINRSRILLKPIRTRPLIQPQQTRINTFFKLDSTAFKTSRAKRITKFAILFPTSFLLAFNGSALFARRLDYFNSYNPYLDDEPAEEGDEDPYYISGAYKNNRITRTGISRSTNYYNPQLGNNKGLLDNLVRSQKNARIPKKKEKSKIRPCYQDDFWSVGINLPAIFNWIFGIKQEENVE